MKQILLSFFILAVSALPAGAVSLGKNLPPIHGFFEADYGYKFKHDKTKRDSYNLLEQRLQLKTRYFPKWFLADWNSEVFFRGDFIVDEYYAGKTKFDLREFYTQFSPTSSVDVKIGRQVFTWGTGDYLFINDVFPKDYVSFFIGRDDEYLKAPSDGARISFYNKIANADLVIIPVFKPNTIPKGDRLSFLDTFEGGIAGRNSERQLIEPPTQFNNTQYALRLYRTFGSYEAALYYYRGFYEMPRGYKDEAHHQLFYPRLDVYGGSLRGPVLGGIGNFEAGYYNSRNDPNGDNRLIENSSFKVMAGYEKDLGHDFRVGVQYFFEQILDYEDYKRALIPQDFYWDEYRHVVTLRLTKLLWNQTLHLSFFAFYSPSDEDGYIRPMVSYDVNDHLTATVGANLMWGKSDITEFGQFEQNSNIYFRIRYSF